jgi:lipoate-protein ligase A
MKKSNSRGRFSPLFANSTASMKYLDLTLPTAAENLALDEALLEEAESAGEPLETLRLWELPAPAVVIGRSSRVAAEVQADVCRQLGIPVLRRISGGAAIIAGPGCLMYSLILSYQRRPALRTLSEAHGEVLDTLAAALSSLAPGVCRRGTSDLTFDAGDQHAVKFSGNSVRCRRSHLLYHGTLLYQFPLSLIERCLTIPPRMPDYREKRPHGAFVVNLPVDAEAMRQALRTAWKADVVRTDWPREAVAQLAAEKYGRAEWNEP